MCHHDMILILRLFLNQFVHLEEEGGEGGATYDNPDASVQEGSEHMYDNPVMAEQYGNPDMSEQQPVSHSQVTMETDGSAATLDLS